MWTSVCGTHARGTESGFRREEQKLGRELQKQVNWVFGFP